MGERRPTKQTKYMLASGVTKKNKEGKVEGLLGGVSF